MKDDKGLYYYPSPFNRKERMYVRKKGTNVEFRLWNDDKPEIWKEHGWIPLDVVRKASELYRKKGIDPLSLYDLNIAERLIKDEEREKGISRS